MNCTLISVNNERNPYRKKKLISKGTPMHFTIREKQNLNNCLIILMNLPKEKGVGGPRFVKSKRHYTVHGCNE